MQGQGQAGPPPRSGNLQMPLAAPFQADMQPRRGSGPLSAPPAPGRHAQGPPLPPAAAAGGAAELLRSRQAAQQLNNEGVHPLAAGVLNTQAGHLAAAASVGLQGKAELPPHLRHMGKR
jgi:hypothetical protein